MEIKYDVCWKTASGSLLMTHGVLSEDDLESAVLAKESRESINHEKVQFSDVSWEGVTL